MREKTAISILTGDTYDGYLMLLVYWVKTNNLKAKHT